MNLHELNQEVSWKWNLLNFVVYVKRIQDPMHLLFDAFGLCSNIWDYTVKLHRKVKLSLHTLWRHVWGVDRMSMTLILTLDTRWEVRGKLDARAALPLWKESTHYPLNMRLGEPQNQRNIFSLWPGCLEKIIL